MSVVIRPEPKSKKPPMVFEGYINCSCRDCFEITIGVEGKGDMCDECLTSHCAGGDTECQSPLAYGQGTDK